MKQRMLGVLVLSALVLAGSLVWTMWTGAAFETRTESQTRHQINLVIARGRLR